MRAAPTRRADDCRTMNYAHHRRPPSDLPRPWSDQDLSPVGHHKLTNRESCHSILCSMVDASADASVVRFRSSAPQEGPAKWRQTGGRGASGKKGATHQLKPGHQPSSLSFLGVAAQGFWRSRPPRSRNGSSRRRPHCGGPTMSRQQLPPQIRKIEVLDRDGQNRCPVPTYGGCRPQSTDW